MKTLRQKYLEQLKKNRTNEQHKLTFKEFAYDQFTRQLNEFYTDRTSGYLSDGCYRTTRKTALS